MWTNHPSLVEPADNTEIWQYMSTEKLLSIISSNALNLARIDILDDPWEGMLTVATMDRVRKEWTGDKRGFGPADCVSDSIRDQKKNIFVNCWHSNPRESAAMWDLYARRNAGVAIRSDVAALKAAIRSDAYLYLALVKYANYSSYITPINLFETIATKRDSFEHEREIRLIHPAESMQPNGHGAPREVRSFKVPINTSSLIKGIYIAPTAPVWHKTAIESTVAMFGMSADIVQQSSMYGDLIV